MIQALSVIIIIRILGDPDFRRSARIPQTTPREHQV